VLEMQEFTAGTGETAEGPDRSVDVDAAGHD
jgi:hypothetical protein